HNGLDGRQPKREFAGEMLDQNAGKTLERAEYRAVQHHGAFARAVLCHVFGIEAFGQHIVDLNGAALPVTPDRVAQHELELRPVEGALARVDRERNADAVTSELECGFGAVPIFFLAGARRGARGELYHEAVEAEVAVDLAQKFYEPLRLGND